MCHDEKASTGRAFGVYAALFIALVLALPGPAAGQDQDREALRSLLATYEEAVARTDPEVLRPHLHPEFSGVMVTGGVVGLALGLLVLTAMLPAIWRSLRRGEGLEDRAAGLAAVGALAAAGLHELFDFGLVIPANALALLVVLGSATAVGSIASSSSSSSS